MNNNVYYRVGILNKVAQVVIPACPSGLTIEASPLFGGYVDEKLKRFPHGEASQEMEAEVFDLINNAYLFEIFRAIRDWRKLENVETLAFPSQGQIVKFCELHRNWLAPKGRMKGTAWGGPTGFEGQTLFLLREVERLSAIRIIHSLTYEEDYSLGASMGLGNEDVNDEFLSSCFSGHLGGLPETRVVVLRK